MRASSCFCGSAMRSAYYGGALRKKAGVVTPSSAHAVCLPGGTRCGRRSYRSMICKERGTRAMTDRPVKGTMPISGKDLAHHAVL